MKRNRSSANIKHEVIFNKSTNLILVSGQRSYWNMAYILFRMGDHFSYIMYGGKNVSHYFIISSWLFEDDLTLEKIPKTPKQIMKYNLYTIQELPNLSKMSIVSIWYENSICPNNGSRFQRFFHLWYAPNDTIWMVLHIPLTELRSVHWICWGHRQSSTWSCNLMLTHCIWEWDQMNLITIWSPSPNIILQVNYPQRST